MLSRLSNAHSQFSEKKDFQFFSSFFGENVHVSNCAFVNSSPNLIFRESHALRAETFEIFFTDYCV